MLLTVTSASHSAALEPASPAAGIVNCHCTAVRVLGSTAVLGTPPTRRASSNAIWNVVPSAVICDDMIGICGEYAPQLAPASTVNEPFGSVLVVPSLQTSSVELTEYCIVQPAEIVPLSVNCTP